MSKTYRPLARDEEHSLDGFPEKGARLSESEDNVVLRTAGGLEKHWMWLVHAILLSLSMTLFALSFCTKTGNPSNPKFLEKIGTYCMPARLYNVVDTPRIANLQ